MYERQRSARYIHGMNDKDLQKLRYPIGFFQPPNEINYLLLEDWIGQLMVFPSILTDLVKGLNEKQLDTPYRPDGWSIRQVVHHLADSHMNSYIRFKLALTEETPTIRPYYEDRWAVLPDYQADIKPSLTLLTGLHVKWVALLRSLVPEDFTKKFIHPEHGEEFTLDWNVGNYAWHGNHHYAQIEQLLKRMDWV